MEKVTNLPTKSPYTPSIVYEAEKEELARETGDGSIRSREKKKT